MRKFTILLTLISAFAPGVSAEEKKTINLSGYLDADMAVDVSNEFKDPQYQANQEIDLTTDISIADQVSVQLYTTFLAGNVPYGGSPANQRWNGLAFDGLTLTWGLDEMKTLYFGDLVYNMGQLNYYAYKRPVAYGAIMPEAYLRGFGADIAGLTVYAGATDLNLGAEENPKVSQFGFYGAYGLALSEAFSLTPKADVRLGGPDAEWHAGIEAALEGDFSLNAAVGAFSEGGANPNFTILLEPGLAAGNFSVAGTYYQAFGDDNATAASIPDDLFIYVEPGLSFNDIVAAGLPLEFHKLEADQFWVVPTVYLYPASGAEIWLWAGGVFEDGEDACFSAGSEVIVNF